LSQEAFIKLIIAAAAFVISVASFAETATVVGISHGSRTFLKLSNGEVRFVEGHLKNFIGDEVETEEPVGSHSLAETKYLPSLLSGRYEANRMYNSFRERAKRNSECFNRAHVWSYEENQQHGTKLHKTFVFFTDSYIRNYNYKWWFHVAPSVTVAEAGVEKNIVIDPTFLDSELEEREWSDFFMESKRACPTVLKYSDYDKNQEKEDCYIMKAPMYFHQPLDIENFEKTGEEKTSFLYDDLWIAYRQAFGKKF
jgi:hypothetical protein